MAFDVFLLPSLYEGFPVAGVEAVCAGLPVLLSDTITPELSCFPMVSYLPIDSTGVWVSALEHVQKNPHRIESAAIVKENGFDLPDAAQKIEQLYLR